MKHFIYFLCVLCALCVSLSAQDFRSVHDGIEYAEMSREISGLTVRMNLLRLDLTKVRLDVVHAMDAAIGTEKTSSIAIRHSAVAAINAGFFRLDNSIFAGDAAGLLIIDNETYSESVNGRVALMIANRAGRTEVSIARTDLQPALLIRQKEFELGVNRARKKDDLLILTPAFGRTTLTDPFGAEFIVRNGKVQAIAFSGSNKIPHNGFVLSASGARLKEVRPLIRIGTRIDVVVRHSTPDETIPTRSFGTSEDVVSGVPQLIREGRVEVTWEKEKASKSFVETRHPRTAVAKLRDGKFLMITVDGRSESSGGIGLYDLAALLLELGATDAMNLDGGGSTTMFLDGKVVNHPSDKEGERKVSDAIIVTLRKLNRDRMR